jgi:acyl carrier protein
LTSQFAEAERRQELCARIKRLIAEVLALDIEPSWIGDDTPLFGRGLELDSLDAIDLIICLEEEFSIQLSDDDAGLLATVNSIADGVEPRTAA